MAQTPTTDTNFQQPYAQNQLDLKADSLSSDVHCSLMRAIDSTHQMPISEHVLLSSYESYDNIMIDQRTKLNDMMSKLSQCSNDRRQYNSYGSSFGASSNSRQVNFNNIQDSRDKYETIHDFSEHMFDRIGQNLDDAAGLRSRDAQLIEATLKAANQNKLLPNQAKIQTSSSRNLSSSSSSFSNKASETSGASQGFNQQQQYRYKKPQTKVTSNQVNSVVQSNYMQLQPRNQQGGYLGKHQFNPQNQRHSTLENKNLNRPQVNFKDKIDNSYRPFEPLIRDKPNKIKPLTMNIEKDEHGLEYYSHPYEYEIQNFEIDDRLLASSNPIKPPDLESTPIVLVENDKQLEEMCKHIENECEFAVDVEHHSYRSFQGITCLLQISTRTQDFVIDAINLRSKLHVLNRSFTNPKIVKIFHGADCDILWLQRDFGIYVVNLFDTSRAAKSMKFAHLSLAFLMKHYCNVDPDKSYQLADWRERPLPYPMLEYARADTHYLLYIYDRLRNDLLRKGGQNKSIGVELLKNVYERGRDICLKRYEKPPFSDTSHLSVLRKSRSTFNAKQMFAFKELYAWRDSISRDLDESVGYVLPNNLMIRIAEYLPREPQGITALCNPIPPTVKKYLSEIHAIILKAIDVPLEETSKTITGNPLNVDPSLRSIDLADSSSHKQDIAHSAGLQESSVPSLLDKMHLLNCSNDEKNANTIDQNLDNSYRQFNKNSHRGINETSSRLYKFFDASSSKNTYYQQESVAHQSMQKQFVSPYHRYVDREN